MTLDHPGSCLACDLDRGVTRAGVIDDDFVGEVAQRVETLRQHGLLVLDDQAGTEQRQRAGGLRCPIRRRIASVGCPAPAASRRRSHRRWHGLVVHEGSVRHEQAQAELGEAHAEIVVLEAADAVALVETIRCGRRRHAARPDRTQPGGCTSVVCTTVLVAPGPRLIGRMRRADPASIGRQSVAWWPDTLSDRGPTAPTSVRRVGPPALRATPPRRRCRC